MAAEEPDRNLDLKGILTHPLILKGVAAGLALGALGAAGGWWFWLKPQRDLARVRYETFQDVSTLFSLQLHYKKVKGVFAPDLDALLTLSPDRDAFKARMADHLDMNTIAVVGDADKFKVEANVLDKDRTLIRLKGPIVTPPRAAPRTLPVASQTDENGAPIDAPR